MLELIFNKGKGFEMDIIYQFFQACCGFVYGNRSFAWQLVFGTVAILGGTIGWVYFTYGIYHLHP